MQFWSNVGLMCKQCNVILCGQEFTCFYIPSEKDIHLLNSIFSVTVAGVIFKFITMSKVHVSCLSILFNFRYMFGITSEARDNQLESQVLF